MTRCLYFWLVDFYMYFGRGETLATLKDGAPFFDGLEVGVSEEGWPHELGLLIGIDEDGQPVLNRLTIERRRDTAKDDLRVEPDRPILVIGGQRPILNPNFGAYTGNGPRTTDLRKIPLDRIFKNACKLAGEQAQARRQRLADEESAARAAAGGRRRPATTSDFLKQVAEIARQNPNAPTRAVSERLYMSHRSATRWIARARKWFPENKESK